MIAVDHGKSGSLRGKEWKDIDYAVESLRRDLHTKNVITRRQLRLRIKDLARDHECSKKFVRAILRTQLVTHYTKVDLDRFDTPAMARALEG